MIGHRVDGGGVSSVSMLGVFTVRGRGQNGEKGVKRAVWSNKSVPYSLICKQARK